MDIPIEPIDRVDMPDKAAQRLKELIISGHLHPCQKLPSFKELAKMFQVGYTTLREAIKELETLHLVEVKQGAGVFVRKDALDQQFLVAPFEVSDEQDLLDLMEVRKIVETAAVKLAVNNINQQQLQRLETLLMKMKENINDSALFINHDISFHVTLAETSGNRILLRTIRGIVSLIYKEQTIVAQPLQVREIGYAHHKQIYKALKNRDIRKATKSMQNHLEEMENFLKVALQNRARRDAALESQKTKSNALSIRL